MEDGSDFKSVIIIMEAIAEALSCGAVYYDLLWWFSLTFGSVDETLKCDHSYESY